MASNNYTQSATTTQSASPQSTPIRRRASSPVQNVYAAHNSMSGGSPYSQSYNVYSVFQSYTPHNMSQTHTSIGPSVAYNSTHPEQYSSSNYDQNYNHNNTQNYTAMTQLYGAQSYSSSSSMSSPSSNNINNNNGNSNIASSALHQNFHRPIPGRRSHSLSKSNLGASLASLYDSPADLQATAQYLEQQLNASRASLHRHYMSMQQHQPPQGCVQTISMPIASPISPSSLPPNSIQNNGTHNNIAHLSSLPSQAETATTQAGTASPAYACPSNTSNHNSGSLSRSAYHSSSVSLLAPALEEKLNSEIRALQRELNLERERNAALNGQLAINSGLMAAFEQSLATLNSRLHQMACANERKAAECAKLQSRLSRCTCLASLSPMCAPREVDVARIDAASIMAEQTVGNSTGDNSAGDADSAMDGRSSSSNSSGSPPPVGQQGAASARAPADSGQKLTKSEELDELVRELNLTPTRRTPNDSNRSVSIRSEQDNGVDDETESTSGDGDTKSDESAQAIIAKLQQELREKDRLLIDTRLEALEAAGQIGQLEQAIADLTLNSSSHTETHSIFKPLEELQLSETDRRRPNGCHTSPLRHRTSSDYQRIV